MLADTEKAMLEYLRQLPLAKHLRQVEPLPDNDSETLVKRFAADAPAVYVVYQDFAIEDGRALLEMAIVCVGRHAAGSCFARRGDSKTIGLYQIIDTLSSSIDGSCIGECSWQVTRVNFMDANVLWRNGLECGVVMISSPGKTLDPAIDVNDLGDFLRFDSQYDIPLHVSSDEHNKWLEEPPDHGTSMPELEDTLLIREKTDGQN